MVIVGDSNPKRLDQARSFGCETLDVSGDPVPDQIEAIPGVPQVDAAVDAVGFEAHGHGSDASHGPSLQTDIRNAGGTWVDEEVLVCPSKGWTLVTGRKPGDLDAFSKAVVEEFSYLSPYSKAIAAGTGATSRDWRSSWGLKRCPDFGQFADASFWAVFEGYPPSDASEEITHGNKGPAGEA